ncbi:MAG: hypothetical protein A2754_00505 [Candidatus Magasanikbacteria bacterium RIFCSPHIGHO2_01_FULL_47_8]|uniref:Uncharacterized protein n=1 Tax=Candidatus Magasanikbacteria bacterium RIFCSPHIGHO2_01_FULL_47_8 TaxID=1798673 RepID=A0A1F6MCG2_9BACT|nr:MAG: hypothetical protein A2754_00505 [Candidatus Magasanikbacteria bacterium RIFCSPHIGHO2_01_FULL_47_8]
METTSKEKFDSLSDSQKMAYIQTHLDLFQSVISARMGILPAFSAIAGGLLVIATFNPALVPLNVTVKVLITILLLIIPVSLFFYNYDLKNSQTRILKSFKNVGIEFEVKPESKLNQVSRVIPDIGIVIFAIIILILVVIIW